MRERSSGGRAWRGAVLAALIGSVSGCVVRAAGYAGYGGYWDTRRCYWEWIDDGYGGHEEMFCWVPSRAGFAVFVQGGAPVRRYPRGYVGPRVIVAPPQVTIVRPPPPPRRPPGPPVVGPIAVPVRPR
jgi:hypothetical protein